VTVADHAEDKVDGRVARRARNRDAVLDVVLELFAEESLFPTIEEASQRSGLSLRSVYRYFADPGELLDAAIKRNREVSTETARLPSVGEGPLKKRVDDFVAMRLGLYDQIGAVYRATVHNAPRHLTISAELSKTRDQLRDQFELQFQHELTRLPPAESKSALATGDVLTQLDTIDFMRRHQVLSAVETSRAIRSALTSVLSS
jgi:AcrR family transcriptional regulator